MPGPHPDLDPGARDAPERRAAGPELAAAARRDEGRQMGRGAGPTWARPALSMPATTVKPPFHERRSDAGRKPAPEQRLGPREMDEKPTKP